MALTAYPMQEDRRFIANFSAPSYKFNYKIINPGFQGMLSQNYYLSNSTQFIPTKPPLTRKPSFKRQFTSTLESIQNPNYEFNKRFKLFRPPRALKCPSTSRPASQGAQWPKDSNSLPVKCISSSSYKTSTYPVSKTSDIPLALKETGAFSNSPLAPCSPAPCTSRSKNENMSMSYGGLDVNPYGSMQGLIQMKCSKPSSLNSSMNGESICLEHFNRETSANLPPNSTDEPCNGKSLQVLEEKMENSIDQFELDNSFQFSLSNRNDHLSFVARLSDQDSQIAFLEEENLILREKLFVAQQNLRELKRTKLICNGEAPSVDIDDATSCSSSCF